MSHKKGAYLGGVRTVEDMRLRSRIDQETGCWRWGLSMSPAQGKSESMGRPKVWVVHAETGKRTAMAGRRAALMLARGQDLPEGHVAFAKMCCKWDDCVNPEHSRSGTRKAHGEWLARTGRNRGLVSIRDAARKVARTRRRLTDEQVIEIRSNPQVGIEEYARRFGVSNFTVWSARKRYRYTDVGRVTSVFDLALAA